MLGEEAVQLRADRTAAFRWVEVAEFGLLRRLAAAGIHVLYRPSRDRTGPKTVNTAGPGGGLTYATPSPGNAHTTAPHEFASRLSQQRVARTSPHQGPSHSGRGPLGGNGHAPSTTMNAPFWRIAVRSHVVRDPPAIETCASAPRLCLEQGRRPPPAHSTTPAKSNYRGFGP